MGARKDSWSQERERPGCGMAPLHWCSKSAGAGLKRNMVFKCSVNEAEWLCAEIDLSGPKQLSLEKSACKVDLWLMSENLDFRRLPIIPRNDQSGSLCLNYVNNAVCAKLLISFWESRIFVCARKRVPVSSTESLMLFLGKQHFTCVLTTYFWRNQVCPAWTLGSLCPVSVDFTPYTFSLADSAVFLSCTKP